MNFFFKESIFSIFYFLSEDRFDAAISLCAIKKCRSIMTPRVVFCSLFVDH